MVIPINENAHWYVLLPRYCTIQLFFSSNAANTSGSELINFFTYFFYIAFYLRFYFTVLRNDPAAPIVLASKVPI